MEQPPIQPPVQPSGAEQEEKTQPEQIEQETRETQYGRIRKITSELLEHLERLGIRDVGDYEVRKFGDFEIDFHGWAPPAGITIKSPTGYAVVQFSLFAMDRSPAQFTDLVVSDKDENEGYVIHANGLKQTKRGEGYPKLEYIWWGENDPDRMGKLAQVRVDLDDQTFANYDGLATQENRYASGDKAKLATLPQKLEGATELAGQEIPWNIDYQQKLAELIDKSRLAELNELLRQQQ